MKRTVYVSAEADGRLLEYLRDTGADVVCVGPTDEVYGAINSHPDIRMCAVTDRRLIKARPGELGREYPECAAFCALCLDRYFIHNLKITDPRLLEAAKEAGKAIWDAVSGFFSIGSPSKLMAYAGEMIDLGVKPTCSSMSVHWLLTEIN